jgi:hypothetical protein
MRLTEAFGRRVLPEPYVACALMPAVLAAHLPATPSWDRITGGLVDGGYRASVAWQTDPQALDAGFAGVRADERAGALVLEGESHGVIGAPLADALLVCAVLDGAPALIAVPREAAGLAIEDLSTSDGGTVSSVRLRQVAAGSSAVLARATRWRGVSAALAEATLASARNWSAWPPRRWTSRSITSGAGAVRPSDRQLPEPAARRRRRAHPAALAIAACAAALTRFETAPGEPATAAAIAAAKARASDAA